MTRTIRFYRISDDYGVLSNFVPYPIEVHGQVWPTSEHYFQAQKFVDPSEREAIRKLATPMQAALWGRDRSKAIRPDWDEARLDVMRQALRAKFTQHESLRRLLLSTSDAKLIEHTANDAFWGDGHGHGRNMLGRLLMELREELRQEEEGP